jgi:hypothetical protein
MLLLIFPAMAPHRSLLELQGTRTHDFAATTAGRSHPRLCAVTSTMGATNPAQMVHAVEKLGADHFRMLFNLLKEMNATPHLNQCT